MQGYRQRFATGGDNASLERQFERDKDDVRELGIPLETIDTPGDAGNNQTLRYRIPKGEYDLPADVRFTPDEFALLSLAAMAWREGVAVRASRAAALLKLRSPGADDATEPVLGVRARASAPATPPSSRSAPRSTGAAVVRFAYIKPGEHEARRREVAPARARAARGPLDARRARARTDGARRTTCSRASSARSPYAVGPHPAPAGRRGARARRARPDLGRAHRHVAVAPAPTPNAGSRAGATPRAATTARLALHYVDPQILAEELAAFGPEVCVLEPAELRERVTARLRAWYRPRRRRAIRRG